MLAGGDPDRLTQLIDVRDLASWMLDCGQHKISGTFVSTSPPGSSTFGRMLESAREVTGAGATITWAADQFLLDAGVEPWTELPLWSPATMGDHVWDADSTAARDAGLTSRPIEETVADTWAWLRETGGASTVNERSSSGRMDPAKERSILESWHAR